MKKLDIVLPGAIKLLAIAFALFTISLPLLPMNALAVRSVHLAFVFALVFLDFIYKDKTINPALKLAKRGIYLVLLVVAVVACVYIYRNSHILMTFRMGMNNAMDLRMGMIVFAMVLIATYLYYGWLITGIVVTFVLYMVFGQYLPLWIGHPGLSTTRMISNITLATEGIFGAPMGAAASTIAIFIIFAAFLEMSTGFTLFMDVAKALFGRVSGGSAKVGVVAGTLFGTVINAAAAVTAAVGSITIPAMKKDGFEPHIAGAIQAAVGTGGQMMPPIMGAAAFIMAEILGVSYATIMSAAIVPALCFYASIFMAVHLYSKKHNIQGSQDLASNMNVKYVIMKSLLLFPIFLLFFLVAFLQLSPATAALYSTGVAILSTLPYKEARFTPKKVLEALHKGAMGIINISIICAACGIIIGVFTVTGLGLRLSGMLIGLSGGSLGILLVLTMVSSLIVGLGVPTVAAYLILAILVAPALVQFGVLPIAAHMFVFYFGIISAITPPVALAAFVGAGIAGVPPLKVSIWACVFALPSFVVPFLFVYEPALLLISDSNFAILQVVFFTLLGCLFCAITTQRYMFSNLNMLQVAMMAAATVLVMLPAGALDFTGIELPAALTAFAGIALAAAVIVPDYLKARKIKLGEGHV